MMEGMTTPALPRRPCLTASSALALPVTCLASHQRGPPQPTVTNHSHTGVPEGSATANLLLRQTGGDMSGETAEAAPAPKSSSSSTTSWVTLATNDSYAVGALVLAVSLRKAETKHSLTVLITHGVTDHMKNVLGEIFDLVHLVDPLDSGDENRLELMSRPELGITLTKIHSWTLTNIDKGVFLDADTLVIRNCDELFEREEFSAAPDVGWPDCFNSGVFVFKPSLETFRNLVQCALTKGSFDGGDQGLLNTYFNEWATKDISRHLPFIYNMVSSATYTYLPAFLKYGSEARIVHFLGSGNKPWLAPFDWSRGVATAPAGAQHSLPLLQLWWDIYAKSVHGKLTREMISIDPTDFELSNCPIHDFNDPWENYIVSEYQQHQQHQQQPQQQQHPNIVPSNFVTNTIPTTTSNHHQHHHHFYFDQNSSMTSGHTHNNHNQQQQHNDIDLLQTHVRHEQIHPQQSQQTKPQHKPTTNHPSSSHNNSSINTSGTPLELNEHTTNNTISFHNNPSLNSSETSLELNTGMFAQFIDKSCVKPCPVYREDKSDDVLCENSLKILDLRHILFVKEEEIGTYSGPQQSSPSLSSETVNNPPAFPQPPLPKSSSSPHVNSFACNCTVDKVDTTNAQDNKDSGLAGVLAQMTIGGTATPAEQTLAEDLNRRQAWEQGIIDYTGRDAFENIWKKICQTIASGPAETSQIPAGSQQAPVDITTKQQVVPATPEEKKAFAIVPMTPPPVLDEFISVKPEDIIALPSPVPENAPEGLVAPEAPKIIETPATPGTPDAALLLGSKPEIQQKLQKTDVVKEQLPAPTEQQADQPVAAESKLTETPSTPALLDSLKEQTTTKTEEVCLSEKKEKSVDVVPASEQVAQEQPVPAAQTEIKLTPEVPVATHEQTQQLEQTPIAPEQTQSSEQVPKAPEVPEASAPVIEQQIAPTTQTQEQAIPTPSAVPEESISSVPTPEQTAPTPIAPSEPSTPLVPVPEQSTPVVPSEENTPPVSAPEQATPAPKESAPTTPTPKSEQITPIPSALEQTTPTPVPVSEHITASLPTTTTPEQSTPTLTKEQSSPEPAPEQTKTASEKPPPPPVPELVPTPESSPATPAPPTPESTSVATTEQTTLVQQSISPSAAVAPPAEQSSTAPAPPTPETISAPPAVPSVSPAQQSDPPSAAVAPPAEQSSTPVPPTPETTSAPTAVPSDSPAQLSAPPSAPVAPPTEQSSTAPAEQPPPAEQTAAPVTAQEQPEKGAAAAPVSPVAATEAPASPAKEATGADPPVPPKRKGKKKSH